MGKTTGISDHHRRSIRMAGYDYGSEGGYFVTIVTYDRKFLFGKIYDGEMVLNNFGRIVKGEWFRTQQIRPNIELFEDEFVVMPNHIHGIIWIVKQKFGLTHSEYLNTKSFSTVGAHCMRPGAYDNTPLRSTSQTLGAILRGFKGIVTKRINDLRGTPGLPVWQRNYYEHIINSEKDYYAISEYIINNPAGWEKDSEFLSPP